MLSNRIRAARNAFLDDFLRTKHASFLRKLALRTLSQRNHQVLFNFEDHSLLLNSNDWLAQRILEDGHWQRPDLESAVTFLRGKGLLPDGGVFLDVGANIGSQTVYAHLTGRFAKAVCIEPDPNNFKILTQNVQLNGLTSKAVLVEKAAGAKNEIMKLMRFSKNSGCSSLIRKADSADSIAGVVEVPVAPVEELLDQVGISKENISLVWVDVEGYEPTALKGMVGLLERRTPMVVEFNGHFYGSLGRAEFADFLGGYYMNYGRIRDGRIEECSMAALREESRCVDIVLY